MAGHPLRPASHLCLGEPLPHQQANGAQAHLRVVACMQRPPFTPRAAAPVVLSGISPSFDRLSRSRRQVTYALLTRAPLYSWSCPHFPARLACVRHAASVRSEPGSNSPVESTHGGDCPPTAPSCNGSVTSKLITLYCRHEGASRLALPSSFQRPAALWRNELYMQWLLRSQPLSDFFGEKIIRRICRLPTCNISSLVSFGKTWKLAAEMRC